MALPLRLRDEIDGDEVVVQKALGGTGAAVYLSTFAAEQGVFLSLGDVDRLIAELTPYSSKAASADRIPVGASVVVEYAEYAEDTHGERAVVVSNTVDPSEHGLAGHFYEVEVEDGETIYARDLTVVDEPAAFDARAAAVEKAAAIVSAFPRSTIVSAASPTAYADATATIAAFLLGEDA